MNKLPSVAQSFSETLSPWHITVLCSACSLRTFGRCRECDNVHTSLAPFTPLGLLISCRVWYPSFLKVRSFAHSTRSSDLISKEGQSLTAFSTLFHVEEWGQAPPACVYYNSCITIHTYMTYFFVCLVQERRLFSLPCWVQDWSGKERGFWTIIERLRGKLSYKYLYTVSVYNLKCAHLKVLLICFLQAATATANSDLPSTHPIRLGLALNYSVFYYEIMNSPER